MHALPTISGLAAHLTEELSPAISPMDPIRANLNTNVSTKSSLKSNGRLGRAALRIAPELSRGSSRVLCLILQPTAASNHASGKGKSPTRTTRAVAEAFLRFSPRVQLREPNMVFIDVASTSKFFKNSARDASSPESGVLECALQLARDIGFEAKAAISDTAAGAQAFAHLHSPFICPPGEERESLQPLSLPLLLHLEGLMPWQNPRAVEQIVTFFYMLGFDKIRDLDRFSLTSFQDRWGETGAVLWKRLRALDRQVVSPLLPTEPLEEYVHLDFPVSLASLLLHQVRRSMIFLFARLQGRSLYASRLVLHLHCEYSNARHKIEIEPSSPSRDLELFLTLLENKLDGTEAAWRTGGGINLDNPIRDFEIEVMPVPERVQQLDFFEPRASDQDKLESLFSLLQQSAIRTGVYEIRDAILPEATWQVTASAMRVAAQAVPASGGAIAARKNDAKKNTEPEKAYRHDPEYGTAVMEAPRPTRLLRQPRRMPIEELQRLHILTGHPIERFESGWWESGTKRDYYFAVSPKGQCLWIYQDLENQEYYLHGYFD